MECISTLHNTIQVANKALQSIIPSDIKSLDEANKAFEDAKNNVINELINIYMYKLNAFINE